ncbi:dnaJ homolog subfamily A member 3, mitochondrial-like [Mya arenaria]|uniref:dnaJ homolog subfamily A member 3, mitochondrial-like n=1 Tax=Mya arenaria TaxID=6604 RepID=UPI0022E51BBB|nr:dnaJ homolog subfamily A member 3, mitochondrial-like [Mya arenaria]
MHVSRASINRMEDLYQILGCVSTASTSQLRKAYQDLALKHHPDKSPAGTSAEQFVKINRAWKILEDHDLRQKYDLKWQERCLAQTYPIQDTVDFDEFEEVVEEEEGFSSADSIDIKDGGLANLVDTDNKIRENHDRCSFNDTRNLAELDVKVINAFPVETTITGQVKDGPVSLIDAERKNEISHSSTRKVQKCSSVYVLECRCGGSYMLTSVDLKLKFDIVCCDSCSLSVRVVYPDDDDESVMTEAQ